MLLGESPPPAITLDFAADYWLLVTFAGVNQTPRQRLASVGYAYMAGGLEAGTEVSGSVSTGTLAAIRGTNTALLDGTYAVYGYSSSTGDTGVSGEATASSGFANGGRFVSYSTSGTAVEGVAFAFSGSAWGGSFWSHSPSGIGVYAHAVADA